MIVPRTYQGKTVGVFGLARSGLAAVRALQAAGARVWAFDDNRDRLDLVAPDVRVDLDAADFSDLDALLLAPGVPLTHPAPHRFVTRANAAGVPLIADFDLFEAARPALAPHRLVAITGTNGKSTTTALITHCLQHAGVPAVMGGNIGTAILDLDPLPAGGVYVIEASSFQLDLTRNFSADIAILLNMAPDHLDRHGSMAAYVAAKGRLFDLQASGADAFISIDDPYSASIAAGHTSARRLTVCGVPGATLRVEDAQLFGDDGAVFDLAACPTLKGVHNHQNALAAYAALGALGVPHADRVAALQDFPGLAHRQELVAEVRGVRFVNDSKATNVDAAGRALSAFKGGVHWIAGGRGKGEDFAPLLASLSGVIHAYYIGEAADEMAGVLGSGAPYSLAGTLDRAVTQAARSATQGQVVLLSPACTAFDAFANFEERGRAFCALVASLNTNLTTKEAGT